MGKPHVPKSLPDGYIDALVAIRSEVRSIIPGGRDPERSYHAKDAAVRGLDRLIGSR